jgi:hypothetical protein
MIFVRKKLDFLSDNDRKIACEKSEGTFLLLVVPKDETPRFWVE